MSEQLTAAQRVKIARGQGRPGTLEFVENLFTDVFVCQGDRLSREDPSIFGAIARFHGKPVTVIGHCKGHNLEERMRCNFGMPSPEGYRKEQRLLRQAEKFGRPVITFVDTPGAYPGLEAEAGGQGEAIARSLALMSSLTVPVITVVIGEGGSGGALALAVGNRVIMLENAVYSVLSPEGFASILWKDANRADEAAGVMKLTAADLLKLGVADQVIPEPDGGAQSDPKPVYEAVDKAISRSLSQLSRERDLAAHRYQKFRAMGVVREENVT
jgi:acetyl-CoA carboxylase carboxyl transferase subunit alpha